MPIVEDPWIKATEPPAPAEVWVPDDLVQPGNPGLISSGWNGWGVDLT